MYFFTRFFHSSSIQKPLGRWILVNPSMDINQFIEIRKKTRQDIKEKGIDPYFLNKKKEEEDTDYLIPFIIQL